MTNCNDTYIKTIKGLVYRTKVTEKNGKSVGFHLLVFGMKFCLAEFKLSYTFIC